MFDNLRKSGSSMIVWVLFGILIAGFVISFGPQSVGSSQGCSGGGGRQTMLTVNGQSIDDAAWRFVWQVTQGGDEGGERKRATLTGLVRRELLAQEAARRGLRVSDDLIDYTITHGEFRSAGHRQDARPAFFDDGGKGVFSYKLFKLFTNNRFNMSIAAYKRQQGREILATTMASILSGSVAVSREEARAQYIADNTTVGYDAVRFAPAAYTRALLVTDADLDRYVAAHEAEVKATYAEAAWKGKKQLRVRRIFVPTTPPPATGATPTVDPAKVKLDAARADIVAGRKTFAAAAGALDNDEAFRARGGDWGWYDEAAMTLPVPTLNDAVKALTKAGELTPVLSAGDGFYLLTVAERREGDLTFEQVKRELAEPLAKPKWGQEAARRAAAAALDAAKASGKPLAELYPANKIGQVEFTRTHDVPTAWMQAGGGSATQDPPAAAPAAPPPPAAPPTPTQVTLAATEQLPALGKVELAVEQKPALPRRGNWTDFGESAALNKALFEELTAGALAPTVFEAKGGEKDPPTYVIVQVTSKTLADVKEFEKDADKYVAELAELRGAQYLSEWLRHKCKALVAGNGIRARTDILVSVDDQGKRTQIAWDPCRSL